MNKMVFRKGRSYSDHLFTLTSIIRNRLACKQSTFCAFIDMEKAFDFLDRDLLFYRLLLYNIKGKLYQSIKALYNLTTSCVKINAACSGWFLSNSGVRQGDSLSPTLFALFINGLPEEIKSLNEGININNRNVPIILYADDIVLIANSEEKLQHMFKWCMYKWCYKWKLKLNVDKSNIVHFRPKRKSLTEFKFQFGEKDLNIVNKYKYLGIVLDEFLNFDSCAKVLSESAGRALGGVIYKFKNLKDVGFKTFEKMYQSGVTTVSDYGSEIWGYTFCSSCNNVHNRAMRYYLGVHRFAPIAGLHGEFGWLSSKFRRYKCILNYWNRLICMNDERLTKHMFMYDYQQCKENWCYDVKRLCSLLNMNMQFDNQDICNKSDVKNNGPMMY